MVAAQAALKPIEQTPAELRQAEVMLGLPPSQINMIINSDAKSEMNNPEKEEEPKKAVQKSDKKAIVEKKDAKP